MAGPYSNRCRGAGLWLLAGRDSRPAFGPTRLAPLTNDLDNKIPRLVSDGSRLYWSDITDSGIRPIQLLATGGDPEPLPIQFADARVTDISRQGDLLILKPAADGPVGMELWSFSPVGHRTRRLGDLLAHDAAISPENGRIAYAAGDSLYLANADGSSPRLLAKLGRSAFFLRWSRMGNGSSSRRATFWNPPGSSRKSTPAPEKSARSCRAGAAPKAPSPSIS